MPLIDNQIAMRLLPSTRFRLQERCERVEMSASAPQGERGRALQHAIFLASGFVALVIESSGHPALEVGMVGREGVIGAELVLGTMRAPWRVKVIGAGEGWRIDAVALREVSATHPDLQRLLHGTVLVRLHQQALWLACDRFHSTASRVARWMLMTLDRVQGGHFHMTHEFLAQMLGVRRVSVTLAANGLQRDGVITYRRGDVRVLDRERLLACACSCYETDRRLLRTMVRDYVRQPTDRPA
ncbi:Crp/Fnr family transcriptional regulator [Hydrogenophaga sp. T2]|uniref:Crp/Fnr family transcriptional regulator n=1 Tax=Hydrogenophaga sp. T2 TaxID=3132823 RepID=UPI003CF85AB7